MKNRNLFQKWNYLCFLLLFFLITADFREDYLCAGTAGDGEASADASAAYSADRPLLMRGKSLQKGVSFVNVNNFNDLKAALSGDKTEIYINEKITIPENLAIPAGKLLLRGYNCCYDTMFEIPQGITVTVSSEIDASGDQTKLYTGPVFDVAAGGTLKLLSGSIYGSVSGNNGGAIVNKGTVEIKGGTLQGHTTTKLGGAIYNEGTLTITGGQMLDNRAMADKNVNAGGAVYNSENGTLHIKGGVLENNYSLGNGGAIYNKGSLTIERGNIRHNKAQKNGNGIYSTMDVTYTGTHYMNADEVISEMNVMVNGSGFQNSASIKAEGFSTLNMSLNTASGKLTCKSLTGILDNNGHIYFSGTGTFTEKVTGSGQFHTSQNLTIDAPLFSNCLTVEKGDIILKSADMKKSDITLLSGTLVSTAGGTVKVRNISLTGGNYIIENPLFDSTKSSLEDCRYLDAERIQCGNNGKLTIKCGNDPVLNQKTDYYVPIGKRVSMSQANVNSAQIMSSSGTLITDGETHSRSLVQESGVSYIKIEPAALYNLKVVFVDAEGKQQLFYQDGAEQVRVSLQMNSGYSANASRIADADGFLIQDSENYGGYQFASVPKGYATVHAGFADQTYRSISGSIDLQKDDTIKLQVKKMDLVPKGVWWTDEGNYDTAKYTELKSAAAGTVINVSTGRELAAVAKIVSAPANGDIAKNLSGITIQVTDDIDLKGYQWNPIGTEQTIFGGVFDGGQHTIKNMSIGYPEVDKSLKHAGLFGSCSNVIQNVVLSDYDMRLKPEQTGASIGGLAGLAQGKIQNCSVLNGNMNVCTSFYTYIGGMIGQSSSAVITQCDVTGLNVNLDSVSPGTNSYYSNYLGGFVGQDSSSKITASKVDNGTLVSDSRYISLNTGGFMGSGAGSDIFNCFCSVSISSKNEQTGTGGFASTILSGKLQNCYSTGNIKSTYAGGFIKMISTGAEISNCYSSCNIAAKYAGGFAHQTLNNAKITDCYTSGILTSDSSASGFIYYIDSNTSEVRNCFFTGSLERSAAASQSWSAESGFSHVIKNSNTKLKNNYALSTIQGNANTVKSGFTYDMETFTEDNIADNFYYSNTGKATKNHLNTDITRILEPSQLIAGKQTTVTYTLHKDDLPGGAKVTSFRFDDSIPGATIKQISDTAFEVIPTIDYGVLHLTGEMTVANARLSQPEGDVPKNWDFQVSPEDTKMPVSEYLLLCKIDFENEQILAPNLEGLKKNDLTGTLDAESNMLRFNLLDGDFGNLIPFASLELQSSVFIPERPKVPLVSCLLSADKKLLMFTTDETHSTYTEENAIRPDTKYEYSLDGGRNYQPLTSTSDGNIVIQLTTGTLSSWPDIKNADDIKDARLRLAATESSFRSKAMAEEAGNEVVPPAPSENVCQVTYYMNNGTNAVYKAFMTTDGTLKAPEPPSRKGYTFNGWYKDRTSKDEAPYDFSQMITEDLKLYAHWEEMSFTITTESDTAENVTHLVYAASDDRENAKAQGIFLEGTRIVLEAAATDDSHTFQCWKDGDTVISTQPIHELEVTKNQTFTACFASSEYQITYQWNDGSDRVYMTDETTDGIAAAPEAPKRNGYQFSGWYETPEGLGDTAYDFTKTVTSDLTLYARWEENLYTIKTEANIAQGVEHLVYEASSDRTMAEASGVFKEGSRIILDAAATDNSLTFQCWKEGDTVISTQPVHELEVTKDQTFTACFAAEKPAQSAPGTPSYLWLTHCELEIIVTSGQEYAIRRQGDLEYSPWQTAGKFTGLESSTTYEIVARRSETDTLSASPASRPLIVMTLKPDPAEDTTPKANTYTVTFMDGTSTIKTQTVAPGDSAEAPVIQKTGYQLSWSILFNNVRNDLIVRAVWKPNIYNINFRVNGGKMNSNIRKTVVYDNIYGELPKPVRKNYQFNGWYDAKTKGTKITPKTQVNLLQDKTLYAQWSKISLKKPTIKTVKNVKGKKAGITWAKQSNVDGYRLEYSTSSKFTKKTTKSVKISALKGTKPEKTISRLKKGKTYYMKIRSYKKDSTGKTLYSSYSKTKKVIIKK